MHGLGNDFIVIDAITQSINLSKEQICFLADRQRGIGCDQILLIEPPETPQADFRYRIFNQDGNEVEHCGNGARCFVKFVHDKKLSGKNPISVETQNGIISLLAQDKDTVRVNMGIPKFEPSSLPYKATESISHSYSITAPTGEEIHFGVVSMGNPHAIIRVDNVDTAPVETIGPFIESHPDFPQGVNVGFLEVCSSNEVRLRVFERGVGETQACGTGACAAIAYARLQGWVDSQVVTHLTGGDLSIEFEKNGSHLHMTGPATHVYNGSITI